MSDIPEGYFLNGKEMMGFRREPILVYPGEPVKKKARRSGRGGGRRFRNQLIERDGDKCHYCNNKMVLPPSEDEKRRLLRPKHMMTIEHIVSRVHGGSRTDIRNMVLACYDCNHSRGGNFVKCECNFCCLARISNGYSI